MASNRQQTYAVLLWLLAALCLVAIGCEDKPSPPPATAPAAKEQTPEQNWVAAWSRGAKAKRPDWAGGTEVLRWPDGVGDDIMKTWAKAKGLAGLSRPQVEQELGPPEKVLKNESVGSVLLLYKDGCVEVLAGTCVGWAPRSANFEKYFVQPDL